MNDLSACQTLPWTVRLLDLSSIKDVWGIMGRRLHPPGNLDGLAQETQQETIRALYPSMRRRVAACIQARDGSTPY
ncbi:transposable element Tcb1 transposase [Trichonephila clavipes]|uniref:Transposable element Tcb1 transposase n=1 Tax=Trichonephila clavipes TaxID=2585209 RepID=A0A8X6WEM3_TRICX|nr:transposable element Tcb1 transposase [Trichonephila clavipes]